MTDHPTTRLDDLVHQRSRLGILAVLAAVHQVEFTVLRDELALTDGNLGRHLQALVDGGLVRLKKSTGGGRPRTSATITRAGRAALNAEAEALRELLAQLDR